MEENKQKVINTVEIISKIQKQVKKSGWFTAMRFWWISEELEDIVKELKNKVDKQERWVPAIGKVFRPLTEVAYDKVRVVMLFDDTSNLITHNSGVPCHIDTEVIEGRVIMRKGSQTADNMLWSLGVPRDERVHDRSRWWKQGVLMVSLSPTCRMDGTSASHEKLWRPYIHRLLEAVNKLDNPVVLLIGKKAMDYEYHIDSPHVICINPIPWKNMTWHEDINRILEEKGQKIIEWV